MIWNHYIDGLRAAHNYISDWEDELAWDFNQGGVYSPKAKYIQLNDEVFNRELRWWWRHLWKLRHTSKAKLLAWSILENKAPT